MRWLTYFILAYIVIGLQIGLTGYFNYHGASPNLVLVAAIFIAINAPRDAALLGCVVLGMMQDLVTQTPLGLYALAYGLVGWFATSAREIVYREHPLTHFALCLFGGLMTGAVLLLHGWIHPPGPAATVEGGAYLGSLRLAPTTLFTAALYTAIVGLVALGILQRIKRLFAFQPSRRKVRAW